VRYGDRNRVCVVTGKSVKIWQNPKMIFPIKKRINTELFGDRMPALELGLTMVGPLRESCNNTCADVYLGNENTQNGSLSEMRNYKGYEMRTNDSLFEMTLTT